MNMYQPVQRVPDFPAMERDILRFWEENRIFEKLREQIADGPHSSFLDGPITANNPMGVHHAWGRSLDCPDPVGLVIRTEYSQSD